MLDALYGIPEKLFIIPRASEAKFTLGERPNAKTVSSDGDCLIQKDHRE